MLTYQITNLGASAVPGVQFLYFLDADIGDDLTDETATVAGSTGLPFPTSYQAGDPDSSSIFTNVLFGSLDDANGATSPTNVSAALGFLIGTLQPGAAATFQVLLSDNGTSLGGPTVTQTDAVFNDNMTISGQFVTVPEPAGLTLLGLALLAVRRIRPDRP